MEEPLKIIPSVTQLYSFFYNNTDFKTYFNYEVDHLIKENLPVDYEFQLNEYNFGIFTKKKIPFLTKAIFPYITHIIQDHNAFLEIEAIQLKNENYFNSEQNLYDKEGLIKLSEKNFESLRKKILLLLLLEFLDDSSKRPSFFYKAEDDYQTVVAKDLDILNISKFITYFKEGEEYQFEIEFLFEHYLYFISNTTKPNGVLMIEQFNFWFFFLLPSTNQKIKHLSYEYYFCEEEKFISEKFVSKINSILFDYHDTAGFIQFLNPRINETTITLTNNQLWIEGVLNNYPNSKEIFSSIQSLEIRDREPKIQGDIKCQHIILNLYGKFSIYRMNSFFNSVKLKSIKTVLINIFEFDHFEYITLIKHSDFLVNLIVTNINSIFLFLKDIIQKIPKSSLELIAVQVKEFTSYKSYMKSIMTKFNEMMREIITVKTNIIISFSDLFDTNEYENNLVKKNTFSFLPNLFLNQEYCLKKAKKRATSFSLTLFEKNLKILMSSTIDFFYLRNYITFPITDLKLGKFSTIKEVNIFLAKLTLHNLPKLEKITFYLKSNKNINYDSLGVFFSFNWPKLALKNIKFLFEEYLSKSNFDVFSIYSDFISKKYFTGKDIAIKGLQKTQSDIAAKKKLPSLNETSMISTNLLNPNHSVLMDITTLVKTTKKNYSSFPLSLILFAQIDNYVEYKMDISSLGEILTKIQRMSFFDKSLEKKKLKDKFQNSILVSEYNNINLNLMVVFAFKRRDLKYRTYNYQKLLTKIKIPGVMNNINIFQNIFRFLKGRRVIFNDFKDSFKVFRRFKDKIKHRNDL